MFFIFCCQECGICTIFATYWNFYYLEFGEYCYLYIFILPYTGVFHPQTKSNLNHIGLLSSICTLVFTLQKKVIKEMCIRLGLSRILKKNNITVLKAIMNPPHLPQIYHR